MNPFDDLSLSTPQFYLTAPYPCSYLPRRAARSQVVTPGSPMTTAIYTGLVQRGFRRSGTYTYRPRCDGCRACVPVRVPVADFAPNRAQRRAIQRHQQLEVSFHPLRYNDEHFALYQRYQIARHDDDGMEGVDQYRSFMLQSQIDSVLVEFREQGALRMVSLIDALDDGLSSVYTFYDPDVANASYGTYNITWQIDLCRRMGLDYLYLGYWIAESDKMAYKANFQPLQKLVEGEWTNLPSTPSPLMGEGRGEGEKCIAALPPLPNPSPTRGEGLCEAKDCN
ncbi:MAG: arginyltransferase [Gallionellaceae bacterium]|jgi:arginine-tRNA-protein transferase|nr:arginyltransferase [Gallionellaceae bacterium]